MELIMQWYKYQTEAFYSERNGYFALYRLLNFYYYYNISNTAV